MSAGGRPWAKDECPQRALVVAPGRDILSTAMENTARVRDGRQRGVII